MSTCYICGDLEHNLETSGIALLYGKEILDRAFIWSNENLFLIPAPGTITPGYLILATHKHIACFSESSEYILNEVTRVWNYIRCVGKRLGLSQYVMFEHGGISMSKRGAACVDHAHLHLVPCLDPNGLRQALALLFPEKILPSLNKITEIRQAEPYILLVTQNQIFSYVAPDAPSQLLRKHLAKQWKVAEKWNWGIYPFQQNFEQTIQMFRGQLEEINI